MATPIKISSAQYPITFHGSVENWKQSVYRWVAEAAQARSQLLIFPEYGSIELTSFASAEVQKNLFQQIQFLSEQNNLFLETYSALSRQFEVYILAPSIPVFSKEKNIPTNRTYFFSPSGQFGFQDKLFMTRFEDEEWGICPAEKLYGESIQKVFETKIGKIAISTCFDIEFADPSWAAASAGAEIILAPSCTETIRGSHRVHIGARARALENQCYVVVSQTVGDSTWSIATDKNVGLAGIYLPPDLDFPEDGILAKGQLNTPGWLTATIDLDVIAKVRENGSVFNFKKNQQLSRIGRTKYQLETLR